MRVCARKRLIDFYISQANVWFRLQGGAFADAKSTAVYAVAEYLANQDGKTIFWPETRAMATEEERSKYTLHAQESIETQKKHNAYAGMSVETFAEYLASLDGKTLDPAKVFDPASME